MNSNTTIKSSIGPITGANNCTIPPIIYATTDTTAINTKIKTKAPIRQPVLPKLKNLIVSFLLISFP